MKVILYSDLHLYNHHKLLINSETALDFLSFINDYAKQNSIDTLICAGDFFHTKSRAYAPHVIQAWIRLKDVYKSGINHYMLIGNHDMSSPNSTMNSILFIYSDYVKVVPDYVFKDFGDTRVHFLSFSSQKFEDFIFADKKKNILIGHIDIVGFVMSNGITAKTGYRIKDFEKFDLVFSGHYHKHQEKENVIYIGSVFQTSFGERNQDHGFIVLDLDTLEWEFIHFNKAPTYKVVDINNAEDVDKIPVENSFLRVRLRDSQMNKFMLRDILFEKGAISVEIIPPEDVKEIETYYNDTLSNDPEEIAIAYLDSIKKTDTYYKKENLLKYFRKIREVSGKIVDYEV
jgi:DNA repair exonuclease SbcCD nuclease subunit